MTGIRAAWRINVQGRAFAPPVIANDLRPGPAHQVPERERGDHDVVERAEHREELGQEVDRRYQPDRGKREHHLRATWDVRIPREVLEEQDQVREEGRELPGGDLPTGQDQRCHQREIDRAKDQQRDDERSHADRLRGAVRDGARACSTAQAARR